MSAPADRTPRRRRRDARAPSRLEAGIARQLSRRAVKRARIQLLVLAPAVAGVLLVYHYRIELFGRQWDTVVRVITAVALVALGWQVARDVGRSLGPALFRRLEPATAGTAGFVIRLATMVAAVILALRVARLDPQTIALSGAFTAVILGLAAQQTLGNLIAGTMLVSARPFQVGDRVRMQGGGLAGSVEGVVGSFGLLYTILTQGADAIMIPNSVVLSVAVAPLREPTGLDVRARLQPSATPVEVQQRLEQALRTPLRGPPNVTLEELDGDEVVVRIGATPARSADGPELASEVLDAISPLAARSPSAS
ncbi:mechanosensitive ion channel domain-containing protein [Conexibacter woesei]|uniref:mechanosensitive ion channel domain-containing protein n=1 Tax=Conexibacter woesei TaxID=191495 RepID=UPI000425A775|nr:mechanosensitive ion channel family protein [Conexibacter woesei]